MQLQEFLNKLNAGNTVHTGSEVHQFMHKAAQEALKLTAQLNNSYHTPDEIRQIFSTIIGKPVDNTFGLFPPSTQTAVKISELENMCLSIWAVNFRTRAVLPLGMKRSLGIM